MAVVYNIFLSVLWEGIDEEGKEMKSLKPNDAIVGYFPGYDNNDLFIDVKFLELYRKAAKTIWDKQGYGGLLLGLGKTVFVFDIDSCGFFEEGEK